MKGVWPAALMGLIALGLAGIVWAADDGPPGPPPGPRVGEGGGPGPRPEIAERIQKELLDRLTKALDLTEQQQKQVAQILDTQRQAAQNWQKEHAQEIKDLRAKFEEARKSGDPEAAKAAGEKLQKLLESGKAALDDMVKQLGEVLTKEQMEKAKAIIDEVIRPRPGGEGGLLAALGRLNLTKEQQDKVKQIMDEAKAAVEKADGPEAKGKVMREALEKIRTDVLTDDQRKQLEEMKKGAPGPMGLLEGLKLTDEQKTKIQEIFKQAREDAEKAAEPADKAKAFQDAIKKVLDEVLTADQKKQWEELRKNMGGPGGPDRRGDNPGPREGPPPPK